nr:MAG TPA: hypothetical protein [Caudoviricetes sp.]
MEKSAQIVLLLYFSRTLTNCRSLFFMAKIKS